MKNWRFFDQYLALFRNRYRIDMVIVTMEDEYELTTHMRSMDLPKRRMVPFPMTFNEPLPRFQGYDIMNVK